MLAIMPSFVFDVTAQKKRLNDLDDFFSSVPFGCSNDGDERGNIT